MTQSLIGYKSKEVEPGYVYAPYIPMVKTGIIESDLLNKAKKKVVAINRDRQIEAILKDKEYTPITIEETEEYKEFQNIYLKPVKGIKSRYSICQINKEK